MFLILATLWFIRETKVILFWLYLWQLKEYHFGRFLDHFRTEKGKQLLLNYLLLFKIILISGPFFFTFFFPFILAFFYFSEVVITLKNIFQKKFKKPVLTKKAVFLILVGLVLEILFLLFLSQFIQEIAWFALVILIFDILTPLIASAIVLIFQPLTALGKKQIIEKARRKRENFKDLLVIGITGSYGKTSTKEFLATILEEKFKILKTQAHQNTDPGIARCILNNLTSEHQIFIVEMAAYGLGEIKSPCRMVQPKIGILTGINEQHLALFGSQENIIKTKYELIESLPEDGLAFFNAKNKYCLELYQKTKIRKFLYGEEATFPGEENILGAVAVAKELRMTEEEISRAVAKIENKFGGIQLKKGINGINIIDATYSANPDGVISHLEYLKTFPGKKVIVMPCLIELGKASKEVHKRIGQKIGEVCAPVKEPAGSHGTLSGLAIITTKDRFRELKDGFIARGGREENILFLENPKEIFEKIKSFFKKGDVVLLESRVPEKLIKSLIPNNEFT